MNWKLVFVGSDSRVQGLEAKVFRLRGLGFSLRFVAFAS